MYTNKSLNFKNDQPYMSIKKNEISIKKKNKVYLLTKNLKTKRSNKKLNHVKIESFLIDK